MELRHLRYFVAVAEELNFTRAAARLHTSQPSLSQQIRQLEGHVGVPLLERSRHHVALTNAGRIFLRETRDILGRIEHAGRLAKRAADGRAGELSLGTFPAADVDPVIGLRTGALDAAFVRGPFDADGLEVLELLHDLACITMERSLAPALHAAIASLYRHAHIRMHAVSSADNVLGHLKLVQEGLVGCDPLAVF